MKESKLTVAQVLFPLSLIAFVLCLSQGYQFSELMRIRDQMRQARTAQDKPLEDANRVQAQLTALALGTNKLAHDGNKNAQDLVDRMKKAGITFGPEVGGQPAPAPAANNGSEGTAMPSDNARP